ncbi:MAG: NADPH-dependent F420 reductase [Actinobacteria bacterium]|nr:NADPH-dependent F420 reductase [Actinomycetota bacterium]
MTQPVPKERLGIVGGTGPQGRGLAVRWALAGYGVLIGSRSREKAEGVADRVRQRAGRDVDVRGCPNDEACAAGDVILVTVPYDAQRSTLPDLRHAVDGKLVVNVVNPVVFDELGPRGVRVEAGSAAQECQDLLPEATVVSAFHEVPARHLWDVGEPVSCDVLICGDDHDAAHRVAHLASDIPGMWGVYCGPLRNSQYVENITPVLLAINRHYDIHAGLRIEGIQRDDTTLHGRADGAPGDGRAAAPGA